MEEKINSLLKSLTDKESEALREAVTALHLKDSSEYSNALWSVVVAIIGDSIDEEGFDIEKISHALDPHL